MPRSENNFDFLRLLAATLVIAGHHYILFAVPERPPTFLGRGLHVLGVEIFFAISGYLIALSWASDPSLWRFSVKRALRIFPGLIGLCVFTVLILHPFAGRLTSLEFLAKPATWQYFWNAALFPIYQLPGYFTDVPVAGVVNGSIWSLPAEISMYTLVLALGLIASLAGKTKLRTLLSAALWAGAVGCLFWWKLRFRGWPVQDVPVIWGTSLGQLADVAVFFVGAAALATWLRPGHFHWLGGILCLVVLYLANPVQREWLEVLLLPYAVIALGRSATPGLRRAGRLGDFSYGMYLYAFPIQQLICSWIALRWGVFLPFAVSVTLTLFLAALSWTYIEKPVLSWKPAGGTRKARAPSLDARPSSPTLP